jgi:TP901 family phage tail tape measure protein
MTQPVGVNLQAENANAYLAALDAVASATNALIAGVKTAAGALTGFESDLNQAASGTDALASAAAAAETKEFDFGHAAAAAGDDVTGLGADAKGAGAGVKGFGDDADKAGDDAEGLGKKSKEGASGIDAIKEAAIGAARRLGEFAVEGLASAAAALGDWVKSGVAAAGDFEAKMNEFASITGDSLDESGQSLTDFKDLFISLGRELPVSTAEVQQAAIEMAKGGIEPATIAAGGLKTALNLAAAGGVDIAASAEIMAKQLGVWVSKSADAATKSQFLAETADLLTQAANASTVGVEDLALGLANAGGVAKIAGLSFRETVTTMALLAPGFSSAADAGTSFKTFLARLQPTTDAAAQAMASLNLLTSEGKSKFYDATGAFIGMDKAAELLHGSLEGMSAAQKEATLQAIFGQDAIRAAAIIAEQGAKGYNDMAGAMAGAGTAAEQAAKRQQGFNVAVDNIMGSLEALQITIGTAVLPSLTSLINLLASGINAVTDYADATLKGETALSTIAATISDYAVPAVAGLTSAVIAWALAQSSSALPAILKLIPAIIAQTGAVIANAAAVAAAAAPYAAIAIAVGGVIKAYTDYQAKLKDATTELLNSRQWWLDSAAAIDRYGNSAAATQAKLAPYANTISVIRDQIQQETQALAQRQNAGQLTEAQYQAELAVINQHAEALKQVTAAYTVEEQKIIDTAAASMTATTTAATLTSANQGLATQTSLTAQDVEKLGQALQKTYQEGQSAVAAFAQTQASYLTGVEERQAAHAATIAGLEKQKQDATTAEQKTGIDAQIAQANQGYADEEQAQAASYANQQAAQTQHLGQMLIDYTVGQAQLGNITKEKAAEITATLEREYGLQETSTATTFLHMAESIDRFASSSGGSIDGLVGELHANEQAAAETQKAMDDYAKEYTATQVNNFLEGKSDANELTSALNAIPKNITINVHTAYSSSGSQTRNDELPAGARAAGGPVDRGSTYLVGEEGPELFTAQRSGTIIPSDALRQALASPAQQAAAVREPAQPGGMQVTNEYHLGVTTNQSPAVVVQSYALMQAMAL